MTKLFFTSFLFITISAMFAQQNWNIAGDKITIQWAANDTPGNVLAEYPRPQLERSGNWINLNGLWQYAILPINEGQNMPAVFQGDILVPFAVESALSGVAKKVGKDSVSWYHRNIAINAIRKNKKTLLHFGAVDWRSEVFVNGKAVGVHEGGYDPFTFDITDALQKGAKQEIAIRVWDPTTDGPQPHGKQAINPRGIMNTSVTGIWQTVWIETVPETYIDYTRQTPDIDNQTVSVQTMVRNLQSGVEVSVSAWKDGKKIAEKTGSDMLVLIPVSDPELWSPDHPFLYI